MRNVQVREIRAYRTSNGRNLLPIGLQNVVEARGGVAEVAKQAGMEAQCLSDMLASDKAPRVDTFNTILRVLGCRLSIQPLECANSNLEHAAEDAVISRPKDEMTRLELPTERGDHS